MKHIGAHVILTAMAIPFFAWTGVSIVNAVERIAIMEAKEVSSKELILRLDRKIDRLTEKMDRLNYALSSPRKPKN